MGDYDLVIKDGIVIDGTRSQRYRADVGIRSGRIAALGRLKTTDARRTLDASGMIVAPGFIDLHTHYDAQLFWDPYLTLSGWHGVTSVVIGNCGFGFAPMRPEMRERAMLTMTRVEAIPHESMRRGLPWDWVTYPEFLDSVERRPKALNVLPYVPVAPLLVWVLGFERAKAGAMPTDAEHRELRRLLHEGMDAGGCGWSAQRLHPEGPGAVQRDYDGGPMVTDIMHDATALQLAEVLAERNHGFMQMALATAETVVLDCFTPATKPFENLTIAEVAERTGKHPVDAMLDLAVADDLRTVFYAEPANVDRAALREIIDYEWIVPGVSDGGAHTKFFTGGRYPTEFLSRIVREEQMCSLEHAHWRLSALPAHCAGFRDRGTLVEGAPADIVVYDPERLECLPTEVAHDFPGGEWRRIQRARGYRFVLVNGGVTIEDDRETGIYSGRLLRHGAL